MPQKAPLPPWLTEGDPWCDGNPGQTPRPKWETNDPEEIAAWNRLLKRREVEDHFTELQKARAKAEELACAIRSEAFDDWVRRCVVAAELPSEWTQARTLYENYLSHARTYGRNRSQQAESVRELATETTWGRMMATLFQKKRRGSGWHYPLKLKRGA